MQHSVEAPTLAALADLVARCDQINRYATQLTAVEEMRIAALAAGILVMRQVLELKPIDASSLPARQARSQHWALSGGHLADAETPAIRRVRGLLVLDEHEQLKVLSDRTWRGQWTSITLWRNGEQGISSTDMMDYLARITRVAQARAPQIARSLLARAEAVVATQGMHAVGPRGRGG